jgi:hypothetical protein
MNWFDLCHLNIFFLAENNKFRNYEKIIWFDKVCRWHVSQRHLQGVHFSKLKLTAHKNLDYFLLKILWTLR